MQKDVPPPEPEQVEPELPTFGYGKFEYRDQSTYQGNWKMFEGHKVKHGHGRATYAGLKGHGKEEYDGDWLEDRMHGYGKYVFTSGAHYTGQWHNGKMHGKGQVTLPNRQVMNVTWVHGQLQGSASLQQGRQTIQIRFVDGMAYKSSEQDSKKSAKRSLLSLDWLNIGLCACAAGLGIFACFTDNDVKL